MPIFIWEGKTRAGEVLKGTMAAKNEENLIAKLRVQQINVTRVRRQAREFRFDFGGRVRPKDLVVFTRQFATMIDAGLPLVQCLDILSTQTENRTFGRVLGEVKAQVEGGSTFSDALRKHPKVFDELFVNLVAAGEVGGILDTILARLAQYIEKVAKLKRQVKGAMAYPAAILVIAIGVIVLLLWKVIPIFERMFKDFGAASLPAATQFVIDMAHGFSSHALSIAVVGGGMVAGVKWGLRTKRGRYVWDSILLKLPVIGGVVRKIVVARFTRTLGTLLGAGVPILDALDIVSRTAGNKVIEAGVAYARERISEGKDLATPLAETKAFPPMVVQMIGVGEQTGAIDAMLAKIADFYEDEVDIAVAALTSLLEPLMMVFLGGVVGGLVVSMYLPIFEMAGNIKTG